MQIYAKIGTMPGTHVFVKYKRKLPIVGDKIKVRPCNSDKSQKYSECIVDEIKKNNIEDIYFMYLI